MAVKITNDYKATIKKSVASYNRKITYYRKKGYRNLPSKTSVKAITGLENRKLINRELKLMSNLNKKSLDAIVVKNELSSIYERNYFNEKLKASKKALRIRIKNIGETEFKVAGRGAGFTYNDRFKLLYKELDEGLNYGRLRNDKLISNMRKYQKISSTSFADYLKMSKDEKQSFMNLLARSETPYINPKIKQSFIDSLNDLGYAYGIDKSKLAIIEKKIMGLSDDDFDRVFTQDLAMQKVFDYYYIMKMQLGSNAFENKNEVEGLFDALYSNIDEIISL